jgi:hypothetical protein
MFVISYSFCYLKIYFKSLGILRNLHPYSSYNHITQNIYLPPWKIDKLISCKCRCTLENFTFWSPSRNNLDSSSYTWNSKELNLLSCHTAIVKFLCEYSCSPYEGQLFSQGLNGLFSLCIVSMSHSASLNS